MSKFSIRFEFDRELFVTKVYERVFRGAVKDSLQRQQGSLRQGTDKVTTTQQTRATIREDPQSKKRSQAIDRKLEEDKRRLQRDCKVLVLGGSAQSGKEDLIKNMKINHQNGYTTGERMTFRHPICRNIIDIAKGLIEAMSEKEIWPESDVNGNYCKFLLEYVLDPNPDAPLEDTVAQAIHALWNDPSVAKFLQSGIETYMMDSAS
jgi:guanine nucleotide-binding protein subunit alpha